MRGRRGEGGEREEEKERGKKLERGKEQVRCMEGKDMKIIDEIKLKSKEPHQ